MLLLGQVNQIFKVFRSVLRFEDTSSLAHKVGFLDVVKAWDVGTEIKHRLWHPFWNIILTQHSSIEVCKRWTDIQALVKKYGVSRVIDHFKQIEVNPDIKSARQYLMSTCEGVDCWYDPEEDEHIENHTAKNCFCKLEMYLPFHLHIAV